MARESMDDLRTQLIAARADLEQVRGEIHRLRAVLAVIQAALAQALDAQRER